MEGIPPRLPSGEATQPNHHMENDMPVTDSTLIKISWDTTTETLTVAALREKFGKTNLFTGDGVWTRPASLSGWDNTQATHLNTVLSVIQPGEAWTCDNCTVSLVDPLADPLLELIEEVQSESFQWNEDGTLNKNPGDDFSESENVLADHDWDDFSLEEGEDMLDAIISMLDGFDADRMASYLMGLQSALDSTPAARACLLLESCDEPFKSGFKRIIENSNVGGAK